MTSPTPGEIRILRNPTVYLLSKQSMVPGELDRFLDDHGVSWASDSSVASEIVTESAGRVCYMSFAKPRPGGNQAYLTHIKEVGHGSVFEHAVWSFLITGVSRSLTHELVRHRAGWAYSQLSQRYVDESVAEYVEPDIIAGDPGTRAICRAMMLEAKAIGDCLGLRLRVDVERRIDGAGALGPHRMSMLQDLERGRSMEVEPLVGVVQELGLYTGIPTPTTDVVLALIRQRAQRATGALH